MTLKQIAKLFDNTIVIYIEDEQNRNVDKITVKNVAKSSFADREVLHIKILAIGMRVQVKGVKS